jgi:hypothetical protein
MVIKRGKKVNSSKKESLKNESIYDRVEREMREKEQKEIDEKKQIEHDRLKEEERKEKIIMKYLTKLDAKFDETQSTHFWSFPDRSGFKKLYATKLEMEKFLSKTPEKYKNRKIAYFSVSFYHDSPKTSVFRQDGIWMGASVIIYTLDNDAKFSKKKKIWGCRWMWKTDDFKLTKFSFKLLETIMYPISEKITTCESLMGLPITYVVELLEKKGVDFGDVLQPLANV